MIKFVITLSDFNQEATSQTVKRWLEEHFKDEDGVCYYKYPIIKTDEGFVPDFTVFTSTNHPLIISCFPYQISDIDYIDEAIWSVDQIDLDPPSWNLERFQRGLKKQLREELLHSRLKPKAILALPLITQHDFEERFGPILSEDKNIHLVWADGNTSAFHHPLEQALSDEEWLATKTISQGLPPRKSLTMTPVNINTLGLAVKKLDTQIRSLDDEQVKVATQIAPGPQRIRGLAGTGKTVLLAMRAANIHLGNPHSKILFTFNTQSLYNQAKALISEFYRTRSGGTDPDWSKIHIRHAWGGFRRPGVYYELCLRQGAQPLRYANGVTLRTCCNHALTSPINPEYDYILVDEAQDFPKEFFQVLYKLSHKPYRIYWAYDELQSLSSLEIPKPEDLFGVNEDGKPRVSLLGEDYPGGIEKDFVLHRSYRCPRKVLMLAHALGLGLYSSRGPIQMLGDKGSWMSIGYEVEAGQLQTGEEVIISRPAINSPNRIEEIYSGQELVMVNTFRDRDAELDWVADSVRKDVQEEGVAPEQIIVIALNGKQVSDIFSPLGRRLRAYQIAYIVPGFQGGKDEFAKPGHVTLSTVYKAKGNEAYIVYILGFEYLYDYSGEIGGRNQAFTSITRSKAWVRITGIGKKMESVKLEIDKILADFPKFKFIFPDKKSFRSLDAENSRRRRVVSGGNRSLRALSEIGENNPEALEALDPEILEKVRSFLNKIPPNSKQ